MSPSSRGNPNPLFLAAVLVLIGIGAALFWQSGYFSSRESGAAQTAEPPAAPAAKAEEARGQTGKKRHSGLDDPTVAIYGNVVDVDGKNQAGVPVYLLNHNQKDTLAATQSNAEGRFEISAVLRGDYQLVASTDVGSSLDDAGQGYPLFVSQDTQRVGPVTLTLRDRARLSVQVVDHRSSSPIPGATVTAQQQVAVTQTVASDGVAYFNLPPGIVTLSAHAEGYAWEHQQMQLRLDQANQAQLRLVRGANVFGKVYEPNGVGREGITVRLWQSRRKHETKTDRDGMYRVEGMRPGQPFEVALLVGEQLVARPGVFTIPTDQSEAEFNFKLPENHFPLKYAVVSGVVMDESGNPVNDALIEFMLGSGKTYATRSGRGGTFELRFEHNSLSTRIRASAPGYADNIQKNVALLLQEENQKVRIVLGPGNTASGQVVSEADGAGLAGVAIFAQSQDELLGDGNWIEVGKSGINGAFELKGLPLSFRLKAQQGGMRSREMGPFEGDQIDLVLPMSNAFLLEAWVVDNESGEPVTDFEVRVLPNGTQTHRSEWSNQQDHGWEPYQNGLKVRDENGSFTVTNVPHTDRFAVEIMAESYAKAEADQNHFEQELKNDGALVHYTHEFRLKRTRPNIAGKVLNEKNNPLRNAWVGLAQADGQPPAPPFWPKPGPASGRGFRFAKTAGNGGFQFTNVNNNQALAIAVFFDGQVRYHALMSEFATQNWGKLTLKITPAGRIDVEVDRDDYPNARSVQIQQEGATVEHIPVPSGAGLFAHTVENLLEGRYQVRLDLDSSNGGPPSFFKGAMVNHKNTARVVFKDDNKAFLRGEILIDGEPYRNLPVILLSFPQLLPLETTTDGAGRFTLENLKAGAYSLFAPGRMRVQAMDYSAQREYIDIPAEGVERRFNFKSLGSVRGQIAGCPVSQVMINGISEDGRPVNITADLEADGRFFANNLPKGEYAVYGDCPPNSKEQLFPLTDPFAIIGEGETVDLGEVTPVDFAHVFLRLVSGYPEFKSRSLSITATDQNGRTLEKKRAVVGDRPIYLGGFRETTIIVEVDANQNDPMRAETRKRTLTLQPAQTSLLEVNVVPNER
ncbi:carboxypeptidase-like regulatory domain-containing protein [Acanthopleuribacter pedis]|uniref:Carboxypeptidase regulatory-like domain-containing protein n=1 Tax=Acanthopleuribacter pedis TaxID=442870 RepID=A0A8J7Q7U9_9BACT|nr:carboxypeptidase-like regulatory domain-containing protein [Acanthopleuribacter pedis]MBO1318469.1 carboxypeptidase regulatory-like domain-containing protein [Acanthopleuribacter pedis]